ncbi:carboxylesterase [Hortaea werneckii]|nr:carboxylesterase [Hortaea werneckii]KAI7070544.1 carboxylesterase [Hortaea werneckii]KAI7225965.1 carboxylesterase [Hortaea werneckii]KAI7329182.1 carboxylesterase [Hortaea werneckii]KAI7378671.1 carboxylesterase [Hortaea werneckii]
MHFLQFLASSISLFTVIGAASTPPTVTVKNGTLQGRHNEQWDQDFFLGIPYAQPPLGDLRFRWPQSIEEKWNGTRDAMEYGYSCYQYKSNFNLSEDCLTLNVVRPSGYDNQSLPVLLWIYGGGLYAGSSADPQYNLSGIVNTASESGQPFIGVSINYRLGVWGFLQNPAILNEGSSNAGLLDQRMAMMWVQENIAAFGGNPKKVTVWGESAGAQSIGLHMHSFGGRDDGLFSSAILESGGPVGASLNPIPFYTSAFENLTRTVGCYDGGSGQYATAHTEALACLRNLTSEQLFNSNYTVVWNPIVDGTFLTAYPSQLAAAGHFIRVPLLTGANTDEGISFSAHGLDNSTAIFNNLLYWRNYELSPPSIRTLLDLYPPIPAQGVPYGNPSNATYPSLGAQWRRDAAIGGDLVMIAQRRKTAREFVAGGVDNVFSYRFDTPLWNDTPPIGATHFDNVVFSFQNISGALGPLPEFENFRELSRGIGRAYASFVWEGQPNGAQGVTGGVGGGKGDNVTGLPFWPRYKLDSPTNIVLNANGSWVEADTWREEGIAFINSISRELLA